MVDRGFRDTDRRAAGTAQDGQGFFSPQSPIRNPQSPSVPFEPALLDVVDEADDEDEDEQPDDGEGAEAAAVVEERPERDGPRVHEHDLHVEHDEDHGDEVELDGVPLAGRPHGVHPALVRARLDLARAEGPEPLGGLDEREGQPEGQQHHHEEGDEVGEHRGDAGAGRGRAGSYARRGAASIEDAGGKGYRVYSSTASASRKAATPITVTRGKGTRCRASKCRSSVTRKAAPAATAQSTNLPSSGSASMRCQR